MKQKWLIPVLCAFMVLALVGCTFFKKIDEKFQGKWETIKIECSGTIHTLPATVDGNLIESGGYYIGENYVFIYCNDRMLPCDGVYSDGNTLIGASRTSFTMIIDGDDAKIIFPDETDHVKKVLKFSWE